VIVGGASLAAHVWARLLNDDLKGHASLVARVYPSTPVPPRLAGPVPAFATLGELIRSGIEVDLVLFGDWGAPQADLVRQALEHRWHVVCDGFAADIRARLPELQGLAMRKRRRLITELSKLAQRVPGVGAAGNVDPRSVLEVEWTRFAGPGTPDAFVTTPRPLVGELMPSLLVMAWPTFGDTPPRQVRAELSWPSDAPCATARLEFEGGGAVVLVISHDRHQTGRDTAELRVAGRRLPTFSPVDVLAGWHAAQLCAVVGAVVSAMGRGQDGNWAGDWAVSSGWVPVVMDAVWRSIGTEGKTVNVRS
jgi:hypothetical protein